MQTMNMPALRGYAEGGSTVNPVLKKGTLQFPTAEELGLPGFDPKTHQFLSAANLMASAKRGGLMRGVPALATGGFPSVQSIIGSGLGGGGNAGGAAGPGGQGGGNASADGPGGVGGNSAAAGDTTAGISTSFSGFLGSLAEGLAAISGPTGLALGLVGAQNGHLGTLAGMIGGAIEGALAPDGPTAIGAEGYSAATGTPGYGGQGTPGVDGNTNSVEGYDPGATNPSTGLPGGPGGNDGYGGAPGGTSSADSGGFGGDGSGGEGGGMAKRGGLIRRGALETAKRAGRHGDSELLHVNKNELGALASTGKLTRNPKTGLPEAFSFGDILGAVGPVVGGIAGGALGGPFGAALGSGLGTVATGGSWRDALVSGAIGFGGSYLANGMPSFENMGDTLNSGFDRIATGLGGIGAQAPAAEGVMVGTDSPGMSASTGDANALQPSVSTDGGGGALTGAPQAQPGGLTGVVTADQLAALNVPQETSYSQANPVNWDGYGDPVSGVPTQQQLAQAGALNSQTARDGLGKDVIDSITTKKALLGIGAAGALGAYAGNQREKAAKLQIEADEAAARRQNLFSSSSSGGSFSMPASRQTRLNLSVDPYHVGERGNQGYVYARGGMVPSYGFGGRVTPPGFANRPAALGRTRRLPVNSDQLRFRSALAGGPMKGPGDGQSDSIPARVADGEYVMPADVVSHLGNGSTDAGGRALDQVVKRARQERTGSARFPPRVNPQAALAGVTK